MGSIAGSDTKPRIPRSLLGQLAVVGATTCFGLSYSVIKWPDTSGSVIAWWRLAVSTVIWWTILLIRRRARGVPFPSIATWKAVAPAALFFGVNISVLFTAVTRTSVAHTEFITALTPILLIPLGHLLFHEQPQWRSLRWGSLSFIGIVIVLSAGPDDGVATLGGDLLMIIAVSAYVSYLLATKRARATGVTTVEFMSIMMPVALVTATPVALTVSADEFIPSTGQTWAAIGILAVLTGMMAHGFVVFAQRTVPIATIGVIQAGQPAQSTFWAWLFLGETISATQVPGMVLVIAGSALVVWFSQRRTGRTP
jgi:drug/metabolite transporter (DMT)-like permease